jgi:putative Mg2+ transporter-C (MgtC) family protein
MLWHLFAIRLGLALLLGAIVGAERQWRQRMAGLRTNALVAAGAAMFVMLSALAAPPDSTFRIAGQVVSCIGFLGAGVILRNGLSITGHGRDRLYGITVLDPVGSIGIARAN